MERYDALARRILGRLAATHEGGGENDHLTLDTWEWPQGVAVYAMMKVYQKTGDAALLRQIQDWYEGHFKKGLPSRNINTTAPMLALTFLYEITKDEGCRARIEDWATWVMEKLPRTEEGGFQHITTHDINPQQIWDDTLYMTCLFLYRAGAVLGMPAWREEAEYQFLLHIKYLHCQETGLWYHGFCFDGRHHFGGAFWGRGNSWFTAGAVDFLDWLEEGPVKRVILTAFQEQCAALKRLQDEKTGLWHTLLDHPDSYLETSASAAIAYGFLKGVRMGYLDASYKEPAERAVAGVIAQVDENGVVGGVSYGTPMGRDLDFYRTVPIQPTAYGQGLAFLMLTEK